ncbi:MAG: rod shape-determining protein MreC [Lachnospiraceae bacterium]|nr:rod shape-determining protein MreC [Lachnospiraceae bacterium]
MKFNKRNNITIDPKYILIIIIVICVIIAVISFRFEDKMTPVRNGVTSVVAPMQKGVNTIGVWLADKKDYFTTMNKLVKENKKLKKQIKKVNEEKQLLQQNKYELKNFRKLYDLDEEYADYPKVAARVISSDPDNWFNTFVIDKGSKHGIKKNMNVIAGNGLVGRVTEVKNSYSTVVSIIDDESNVSGSVLKTKDHCIVSGNLSTMNQGIIDVSGIKADSKVKDGYEVVTSQISDRYLPGILIGYVKDVKKDSSNLTLTGSLVPAVDFTNLEMVLVITELKDSEDLEEMLK